jgi:UDP-3-O-[3-hydroxymyristoyl] glucosamine N-acyltransferase
MRAHVEDLARLAELKASVESSRALARWSAESTVDTKVHRPARRGHIVRQRKYEEFDADNGTALRYSRHENGGGFVESRARVAATAHVGPSAYVDRGAIVGAYARIGSGAWIDGGAIVHEGAVIGPAAHIGPGAVVGRGARIGSRVKIGAEAHVWDAARVESDEIIRPSSVVHADSRGRRAA